MVLQINGKSASIIDALIRFKGDSGIEASYFLTSFGRQKSSKYSGAFIIKGLLIYLKQTRMEQLEERPSDGWVACLKTTQFVLNSAWLFAALFHFYDAI